MFIGRVFGYMKEGLRDPRAAALGLAVTLGIVTIGHALASHDRHAAGDPVSYEEPSEAQHHENTIARKFIVRSYIKDGLARHMVEDAEGIKLRHEFCDKLTLVEIFGHSGRTNRFAGAKREDGKNVCANGVLNEGDNWLAEPDSRYGGFQLFSIVDKQIDPND
jgi:hypothetical protein